MQYYYDGRTSRTRSRIWSSIASVAAAATTPLWQATYPGVAVSNGAYAASLGDGATSLEASVLGRARWMLVSVDGAPLLPMHSLLDAASA